MAVQLPSSDPLIPLIQYETPVFRTQSYFCLSVVMAIMGITLTACGTIIYSFHLKDTRSD